MLIAYPALVNKEQLQEPIVTSPRYGVCKVMHQPLWILSDIAALRTETAHLIRRKIRMMAQQRDIDRD